MGIENKGIRTLIPTMPTTDQLLPYLRKIDDSRWYSNFGPLNSELVSRLAKYFEVAEEEVCLISNATLGLQAIAELMDVKPDIYIDLPSFTFAASPSSLISAGRNFRFLDVDEEMRCIPAPDSRVIMDVLPFGESIRHETWMNSLEFLMIDAAASFDALKSVGRNISFGCDYAIVLSLHATKLIGAGEGGVVISSNKELIRKIKLWQNFGFDLANNSKRVAMISGTNAKMSEYNCAIALASLDNWAITREMYLGIQLKAKAISQQYNLRTHSAMRTGKINPYWILIAENAQIKNNIENKCRISNFETRLWWEYGCHQMPAFIGFNSLNLAHTKSISERYLALPFHLHLPQDYWEQIRNILEDAIR
jgi:dTDP-4-amino-4,6-dideoxygalactose transaminase